MSTAAKQLPVPTHFDPKNASKVYRVPYAELAESAADWAGEHGVTPAAKDSFRICVMPIDAQNTFCLPDFELFVAGRSGNGAIDDNVRFCEFVYRNLDKITTIAPTMDTHTAMQIFHPIFWVDTNGNHPVGGQTMISLEDVQKGTWKVNPAVSSSIGVNYITLQKHALHYVKTLSDNGKYMLLVWPYHAMLGGVGHALVSAVEEACFFHNIARKSQTLFEIKGGNPITENYSVLAPEVTTGPNGDPIPNAQPNVAFYKKLVSYDAIIIAGQAKSHCVAWTIQDLLDNILQQDASLAEKVYLLEDCTSSVVVRDPSGNIIPGLDFTDMGDDAFQKFSDAGMHIVKSTTPIEDWDGISL